MKCEGITVELFSEMKISRENESRLDVVVR